MGVLPGFMIRSELKKGQLIDLASRERFVWDLQVIKRRASPLSGIAAAFIEEIKT